MVIYISRVPRLGSRNELKIYGPSAATVPRNAHLHVYAAECRASHAKFREPVEKISPSGGRENNRDLRSLFRELNCSNGSIV